MRITNNMLNESARKAGLPLNSTSILNYINEDTKNSSLLSALKKNTSAVDTENKKKYEKLGKEADKLTSSSAALKKNGAENLFKQAKESGDRQKIYDGIANLFEDYNSILKALKNTSGTLNDFYRKMLSEASKEEKESLASIGITFEEDGTADVDMDKLKEADLETLEGMFGSRSDIVSRMNFISARISDNAKANVDSLGNTYNAGGNLNSESTESKYNFWG